MYRGSAESDLRRSLYNATSNSSKDTLDTRTRMYSTKDVSADDDDDDDDDDAALF